MSTPLDSVRLYTAAVSSRDEVARAALAPVLADNVVVAGIVGGGTGKERVLAALADPARSRLLEPATWGEPDLRDGVAEVAATLPPQAPMAGAKLTIALDAGGRIMRVEQELIPAPPPPATALVLTPAIKDAVNGAFANGTPVIVAYVDAEGRPHLSPRGTAQAFSDDQLALWNRDPRGGMTRGIAANPNVALSYRDPKTRTAYQFAGRARVATEPAERTRIYDSSPEIERNMDPRRRGVAVIVDLDRVEGGSPSGRVRMERQ
jgi:predicted pyridoxine 5'-phosphate oxidase superfamily flavin-nucleotide-binding protein